MNKLILEIISPTKILYNAKILSISFPSIEGQITILPNHVNILTRINKGTLIIKTLSKRLDKLIVNDGFLEVFNNKINAIIKSKHIIKKRIDYFLKNNDFKNICDIQFEKQLKKNLTELNFEFNI
ncbi:MAG: F0F1 ATP synthase subunit epsilon [Endomicrobium sp.]|jgi:F-type H+-transporting ATPase subunit epsilon|nr:F0F1 ATP synthase subunit epsilon [Endomicrobium sp.]